MDSNAPKRGLGALLQRTTPGVGQAPTSLPDLSSVSIASIRPNPDQPRKEFDQTALEELADSIRSKGVLQPIVLRTLAPDESTGEIKYELIAGERRWRASQKAGLTAIPAVVKVISNASDVLLMALIENLQRDDLNPLEESRAYQRLQSSFGITQDSIATSVGKSRPYIANSIRLLDLPESVQEALQSGSLSVGHAKVLLGIPDRRLQAQLAAKCQAEALSVRQLEIFAVGKEKAATVGARRSKASRGKAGDQAHLQDIENKLRKHFGTRVSVEEGARKGRITIEFYSVSDFDRITKLMGLTNT